MATGLEFLLVVLNGAGLLLVLIFAVQIAAAFFARRPDDAPAGPRPPLAVLMPAHQEEAGIARTLTALVPQLRAGDRLLVVADNCTDATVALAREAGAEVVERTDPARRGKGYALDFGLAALERSADSREVDSTSLENARAADPPPVVVIVDADCTLHPGALDALACTVAVTGRPAQGCYLMAAPEDAGLSLKVAELAFLVKNEVRPSGLHRLGLPCQLTGTGMAFPFATLRRANLASGHLVEDMRLGLDLALAGSPPVFCQAARIDSVFPTSEAGERSQRQRWEEGHLGMIAFALSRLPAAMARGNAGAVGLILDLLVPPLTLLLLAAIALFAVTALATLVFALPGLGLGLSALTLGVLVLAVLAAWAGFGRAVLPLGEMVQVIPFIARKLGLYARLAAGKRAGGWVRTDRGGKEP